MDTGGDEEMKDRYEEDEDEDVRMQEETLSVVEIKNTGQMQCLVGDRRSHRGEHSWDPSDQGQC